jgi:CRISPR-associated protein Cas1
MGALLARVCDPGALAEAWKKVLHHDAEDDVLSAGVQRFARDADARLEELRARLSGGDYRPAPLTRVSIVKDDGQERALHIPPVADRIVERAVLSVLTPLIDPLLGPGSFAYRPGLGVLHAVQEVVRLRDQGFTHVLRTDIADCFPSVRVEGLRRILSVIVPDPELMEIVDLLLTRPLPGLGRRRNPTGIGLPQGSPLSPIFANLVLEHFDDRLRREGYPVVRYSDDAAILATSRDDALEAHRIASKAAEEIGMTLGEDKTDIMSFETGFCFLGEDFGTRYPPVVENRIDVPDERTLFVSAAGSRVRIDEGRVVVERDEQELLDVPAGLVARIVCFGPVGVTAGLRNWALSTGVELVFCSQRGRYLGQIIGGHTNRVQRLRHQLAVAETPDRYLPVAREIVAAKIRKQAVLLRRVMRKDTAQELAESVGIMEGYAVMLPEAVTREEIMGLEGAAARAYFQAWVACVDPSFGFTGRNRRPPLDVVNSALSFGYAILLSEAVSALVATGLDPAIGFLHTDQDGRPSLALDLVEEFRPLVVDQIVMEALRRRRLRPEHGRQDENRGGVLLTAAGREVVLDAYERRMLQMTRGALPDFAGTLRRHLYRQAQVLAAWVENLAPGYVGLSWR